MGRTLVLMNFMITLFLLINLPLAKLVAFYFPYLHLINFTISFLIITYHFAKLTINAKNPENLSLEYPGPPRCKEMTGSQLLASLREATNELAKLRFQFLYSEPLLQNLFFHYNLVL